MPGGETGPQSPNKFKRKQPGRKSSGHGHRSAEPKLDDDEEDFFFPNPYETASVCPSGSEGVSTKTPKWSEICSTAISKDVTGFTYGKKSLSWLQQLGFQKSQEDGGSTVTITKESKNE